MNLTRFQAWNWAYEAAFDALEQVDPDANDEIIADLIASYLMVSTSARVTTCRSAARLTPAAFSKQWRVVPGYSPGIRLDRRRYPTTGRAKRALGSRRATGSRSSLDSRGDAPGHAVSRHVVVDGSGVSMGPPESVRRRRRERIAYQAERQRGRRNGRVAREGLSRLREKLGNVTTTVSFTGA